MESKLSTALAKKLTTGVRENLTRQVSELKDDVFRKLKAESPRSQATTADALVTPLASSIASFYAKNTKTINKKIDFVDKKYSDSIKALDNVYQLRFDDYDKKYLKIKRAFTDLGVDLDKITPGHLSYDESLRKVRRAGNDNSKTRIADRLHSNMPVTKAIVGAVEKAVELAISGIEFGLGTTIAGGIAGAAAASARAALSGARAAGRLGASGARTALQGARAGAGSLARIGSSAAGYLPELLAATEGIGIGGMAAGAAGVAGLGLLAYGGYKAYRGDFGTAEEIKKKIQSTRPTGFNPRGAPTATFAKPEAVQKIEPKVATPAQAAPDKNDYSDTVSWKLADYAVDSMNDYIVIAKKKVSFKGKELILDFDRITIKNLQPTLNSTPARTEKEATAATTRSRSPDPTKAGLSKNDAVDQDEDLKNFEQNGGNLPGISRGSSNYAPYSGGGGDSSPSASTENTTNPAINQAQPVVGVNPTGSAGIFGSINSPGSKAQQQSASSDNSSAPKTVEGGSPYLAKQRAKYFEELDKDPALKDEVMRAIRAENGKSGKAESAVLESMVNRSVMYKYPSLRTALHDGFYGPVNDRRSSFTAPLSKSDLDKGTEAVNLVRGGSNRIQLRTDQGMLTDPGSQEYLQMSDKGGHIVVDGENYFFKGTGRDNRGRDFFNTQSKLMQEYDSQFAKGGDPSQQSNGPKEGSTDFWNSTKDNSKPVVADQSHFSYAGRAANQGVGKMDPRINEIIKQAAAEFPLRVSLYSGQAGREGSANHGEGVAADIAIYDANGRSIKNYQDPRTYRLYELFAQKTKEVQMRMYPELKNDWNWGGQFGNAGNPRALRYGDNDEMHFQIGHPERFRGSIEKGLDPQFRDIYSNNSLTPELGPAGLPMPKSEDLAKQLEKIKGFKLPDDFKDGPLPGIGPQKSDSNEMAVAPVKDILNSAANPFMKSKFEQKDAVPKVNEDAGAQAQRIEDEQLASEGGAATPDNQTPKHSRRIELIQATDGAEDLKPREKYTIDSDPKDSPKVADKATPDPGKDSGPTPKDNLERPIHDPEKEAPSPGSDGYGRGNQGAADSIN